MKKMKKLFSKIVTLVLLVAMLIPFTNIPKVDAEEECANGEWQYHTNYYFFLQAEYPISWAQMTLDYEDAASSTRNYSRYWTSFLYNFPSDGSTVDFDCEDCSNGFVYLNEDEDKVSSSFDPTSSNSKKVWGIADFYEQYMAKYEETSTYTGALDEYQFTVDSDDSNAPIVTYSFHGDWANVSYDEGTYKKSSKKWNLNDADIQDADDDLTLDSARIKELVNATIYLEPNANEIENIKIGSASKNALSSNDLYDMDDVFTSIKSYSSNGDGRNVINKYNISGYNKQIPVIDLVIGREYEPEQLFNTSKGDGVTEMTAIETDDAGNVTAYKVKYNGADASLDFSKTQSSGIYIDGDKVSDKVAVELTNPSDDKEGHWYLAPSLYQISYRVCKAGNDAADGTVTVTYDGNAEGVKNVPEKATIKSGNDYTVATQEPTLAGNTFKNWNLSKNCDGKNIEPGAKLENLTNNVTLYACWGTTGTTNNGSTGVLTYAGLFTGIIALAGGSYYLIKKKNVFKKI